MITHRILPALCTVAVVVLSKPLSGTDFVHEVMPVLKAHCTECHTGDKKKGGLSMNTRAELLAGSERGEVVVPGDAAKSLLIELTASKHDDEWMPPKGDRVPPEQIQILRDWINGGMPWEPGITLGASAWEPPLKPRTVELPPVREGRAHPIDRLLDADLAARRATPPPAAGDAAFLRRATLDATGLLPKPEDLAAFLADPGSTKRVAVVERLLADDIAYADHWLTTWNDLLRNDYTGTGFITGGRKQITSWLYDALRDNKPYDQFVRELIAPTEASAGFIGGIKWRGDVNASQTTDIQFAQNISQVFLGVNMKCASCHDSFIDGWKLEDAYNLAAITATGPLELHRCDKPTGVMAKAAWIFPELGEVDPAAPREVRLKQLSQLMTHPENGRFTRTVVNRIWERLMGRGIVHPVDAMHTKPWNEDLLDHLAVRFTEDGYDLRKLIAHIMSSEAYGSETVILTREPGRDYAYAGPIAKRMSAEQFLDAIWEITGSHPEKAAVELPRFKNENPPHPIPEVKASWIWHAGKQTKKSQFRRGFAVPAEPVFATLQATCDNAFALRLNGVEVAKSDDWMVPVHLDVTAHLRAGENLIEVDSEMFGGGAGFIAQLSIQLSEGNPITISTDAHWQAKPPAAAAEAWAAAKLVAAYPAPPWGPVFQEWRVRLPARAALLQNDFLMRSLGRPHRDQVVTSRPAGLTTLQAIDLANGDILAGYLKVGAERLLSGDSTPGDIAPELFQHALSRPATGAEREVLTALVSAAPTPQQAAEDLLWLTFMHPEFQLIR